MFNGKYKHIFKHAYIKCDVIFKQKCLIISLNIQNSKKLKIYVIFLSEKQVEGI